MRFEVESIGAVKKKINVEIPAEAVKNEVEAAYSRLKNQVKMDGFRKGKVPRSILERHYKDKVENDVTSKLINDSFNRVLSEKNISPISDPEINADNLSLGNDFKFSAIVEIRPEIEVKGYEGLRIEKEKVSITDAMVDEGVEALRRQHLTFKDVQRPLKDGDNATIDFEGFMNGTPFPGGKGNDVSLTIGSGRFIPGFEEQIIGMTVGEEKTIDVKFPADYNHKDYAGKEATFKVKLKAVSEAILPVVDDEFAKDVGFQSLVALRENVRSGMEKEEDIKLRNKMRDRIVEALIEINPIEVPQSMVKRQKDYLVSDLKNKYGQSGANIDNEIEKDARLAENLEKNALSQVKGAMLLMGIANKEGLNVSDSELDERLNILAAEANMEVATLRAYYEKHKVLEAIRREVLNDKIFDFVMSKAKVVEV